MVARQRRGTSSAPRPLTAAVLVAALAVTGAVVWRSRADTGGGALAAEASGTASGASSGTAAGLAPRAALARPPLVTAPSAALTEAVRASIARGIESARVASGGQANASNVRVAVCARELGTGRELVAIAPEVALAPASNLKLVTTAAALVLLGPTWCFETVLEASAPLEGGVLRGDLVVRAGGDPLWSPADDGRAEALLDPAIASLVGAGLREVTGDLVLDRGSFAAPAPAPGWPPADQHWADYCAFAAGLTINGSVLVASLEADGVGPARIEVHPSPHGLSERYGVNAVQGGRLDVRVGATVSAVTVRGEMPTSASPWSASFSHPDPEGLFGSVLRARLAAAGIRVRGATRVTSGAPRGSTELARLRTPLASVLHPINADSVNSVADQVFLATGLAVAGAGTRAAGREATARALERLGVPRAGLVQVDGSGLSRDNRVTARQVTALVDGVLTGDRAVAREYLDSLAVAGESGTLDDRLRGDAVRGRVHAKTGWISGASALSGIARPVGRRELVFSILVEYPRELGGLNTKAWKPMQDEIAALFVELAP